jgi:sugar lactone lactonase YvrE
MRVLTPHPVTEPDCELAEGPVWYDHTLTWVDIPAGRIHHADAQLRRMPATTLDQPVGAVVPVTGGGWLAEHRRCRCASALVGD